MMEQSQLQGMSSGEDTDEEGGEGAHSLEKTIELPQKQSPMWLRSNRGKYEEDCCKEKGIS